MKYSSGCSHGVSWGRECAQCSRNQRRWFLGLALVVLALFAWLYMT